jgi:hypothetical protein
MIINMNQKRILRTPALMLICVLLGGTAHAQHFEYKEHHLGPTGLFGVTSPKDITIAKVDKGSPADGKIKVGDVIVGVGGAEFKDNTRRLLADAIDRAETEAAKGVLTLTLKDGKKVDLQLKVMGSYGDTAPVDGPKTNAIITQAAEQIAKSKSFASHGLPIGLLGLLATGEAKYIDVVKEEIHKAKWAAPDVKLTLSPVSSAWGYGYTTLLLCEYHLATGDKYVLPAIEAYAVTLAQGRDAAGLWGHRMADPAANRGQLHGRLFGYAVMNQSSLPCFISLLLADKCGVRHPEVQAAIEQAGSFYADFIGKGTLPYGVHNPNGKSFNNNGMSGLAAVAMSLNGNKHGAAFFSRMCTAASDTLESGHTGHYFSQMWTGLGANLAGPEASAAFFRETRWLHTLNRTWDGNFTYDGCGYKQPTYSYRGLSDAGSHLLNHCLGRHKLFITGKDADPSIWLKGNEVAETIALSNYDVKSKSDDELLALFGHPMPKLRGEAAWTLRERKHDLLGSIITMTQKGTKDQRLSAIGYFGYKCPPEQAQKAIGGLGTILRDPAEDTEIRAATAGSLAYQGEAAYPYFDDMLKLVVGDEPNDPLDRVDERVGGSLNDMCGNPHAAGLVKDKKLFYAAVHKLLGHKRAAGRTSGAKLVAHIPIEDFHYVGDKLTYLLADQDLTYHSYHNLGPQEETISILADLNIAGGIEAAFRILDADTGKAGFKIRMLMAVLPKYGANAQYVLPKIKEMKAGKFQNQWDAMIKTIETAKGTSKMISMEEANKAGAKP